MKLPYLNEISVSREFIDVFRGYNHNLRIGDGEFYDMKNLTSDKYPLLASRRLRGMCDTLTSPNGIIAKDSLCYVDGPDFFVGAQKYELGLNNKKKTLVSMGAYVLIFPDKKYVNTKTHDYGNIGEATMTVECSLCDSNGDEGSYYVSDSDPTFADDFTNVSVWIDTSTSPYTAKRKSGVQWVDTISYIKISASGIDKYFSPNNTIDKTGLVSETVTITSDVVKAVGNGYIIVPGTMGEGVETATLTIRKDIPSMDFVVESGNRLWGCRYGTQIESTPSGSQVTTINEIYASKLGNFHVWDSYQGISTDSYAASVGSDGPFTGAITYLGRPIFFKEKCMHVVYGNYPANYQIETTECRGVAGTSAKSLAIVNGVLYYKSEAGVCAYDGSSPVEISSVFGDKLYSNAAAGALGNKYYISMYNYEDEGYSLFVYDTVKGIWHKEDDTQAVDFAAWGGDLIFIDYADKQIKSVLGSSISVMHYMVPEEKVKWMAETGIIGIDSPDKKYISRLDVRLSIEFGGEVRFWAQYDSADEWEYICTIKGAGLKTFAAPIRPKRCDHLRLRIEGEGDVKIFSICKTREEGSDA